VNKVEPEALNFHPRYSIYEYAREYQSCPNSLLDACGDRYHDLNLLIKKYNIPAILRKRKLSNLDDYYYAIKDHITHENYNLAEFLARDKDIDLATLARLLRETESGRITLEEALAQYRKMHNTSGSNMTSEKFGENTTKRKGWTKEQFILHIQSKMEKRSFQKSELKDSELRNLAKLLGTTDEQVRNMDKQEYRRLSIKFHPDSAGKGKEDIFCILNCLYNCK